MTDTAARERARQLLRDDFIVYPERALWIVDKAGQSVPFRLKRPQVRLARGLMAQRERGEPMRAVVLKARQVGFSTQAQGMLVQRVTQIPYHYALVVGHDTRTAGELFGIGHRMWQKLPADLKPPIAYGTLARGGRKHMQFGEASLLARRAGVMGLDSTLEISTARDVDAGRGLTIRSLHLSEVAFWQWPEKLTGLLQAVPDDPDTLIIFESTAKGHNHFRDAWLAAEDGSSGYMAMFTPWFEEETYRRPFIADTDRRRFIESIGTGPYGDDEPELLEVIPRELRRLADEAGLPLEDDDEQLLERTYEHLCWRRWAIPAKCGGKLEKFHVEYPSDAEEAFMATGRKVFRAEIVRPVLRAVDETDPRQPTEATPGPARGAFVATDKRVVKAPRGITIEVPKAVVWTPALKLPPALSARWEVWEAPQKAAVTAEGVRIPKGQYIVACDPMSGEENEGELANHAIQVVNHRTLAQAAQYESQDDPDQVALECLHAALQYHGAWIVVEVTGGWGNSIVQRLARDYRYPRVYARDQPQKRMLKHLERLGWSTDVQTKPLLIDRATEVLRDEIVGAIRSRRLAGQLLTYVRDERGRTAPEPKKLADLLMAWMIAQKVAELRPLKPDRPRGHVPGRPYRRPREIA